MQFLKLKTLSWNPSWYQKYTYAPQELWQREAPVNISSDPRGVLKRGKKKRDSRWGAIFPWWRLKEI